MSTFEDALKQFRERVDELQRRKLTRIRYTLRDLVLPKSGAPCWHCGAPAVHVETLVPERTGGPVRLGNLIAACPRCRETRGDLDVLEFAEMNRRTLTTTQVSQRYAALAISENHAVPASRQRSQALRRAYLEGSRWNHPRVPLAVCVAERGVFVAALQAHPGPYTGALIAEMRKARGVLHTKGISLAPIEAWRDGSQTLIERHAIFTPV